MIHKTFNFEVAMEDEPGIYNWDDAQTACSLRGNGWRLPTREEQSLMQEHKEGLGLIDDDYWSSSEDNSGYALAQNFYDGYHYYYSKQNYKYVRVVRTVEVE